VLNLYALAATALFTYISRLSCAYCRHSEIMQIS